MHVPLSTSPSVLFEDQEGEEWSSGGIFGKDIKVGQNHKLEHDSMFMSIYYILLFKGSIEAKINRSPADCEG